jgi:hypothetical protein
MKAVVGGGSAGLAAAARSSERERVRSGHHTHEAEDNRRRVLLDGDAGSGYNRPAHLRIRSSLRWILDDPHLLPEHQCAEQFHFNGEHPFDDQRTSSIMTSAGAWAAIYLPWRRLALQASSRPASLQGQLIETFSRFRDGVWLPGRRSWVRCRSTGHRVPAFPNRFVYLFPDLSSMAHVFRPIQPAKPSQVSGRLKAGNFVKGAVEDAASLECPLADRRPTRHPVG